MNFGGEGWERHTWRRLDTPPTLVGKKSSFLHPRIDPAQWTILEQPSTSLWRLSLLSKLPLTSVISGCSRREIFFEVRMSPRTVTPAWHKWWAMVCPIKPEIPVRATVRCIRNREEVSTSSERSPQAYYAERGSVGTKTSHCTRFRKSAFARERDNFPEEVRGRVLGAISSI